jgi:hypothetical protein
MGFHPHHQASLPKNISNRALEPVTDQFQGIERDVLLAEFEPMKR